MRSQCRRALPVCLLNSPQEETSTEDPAKYLPAKTVDARGGIRLLDSWSATCHRKYLEILTS